ncbi:MAG TPA: hypothetical protein VLR93_04335 [Patescibacteria group bacterium]|nr:hypothetical protein [Patescibacteria group bacterium]
MFLAESRARALHGSPFTVICIVATILFAACTSVGPASQPSPSQPSVTPGATVAAVSPPATSPSATATAAPSAPAVVPPSPVPARDAQLSGPIGLVVDAAGNLYVSECDWTFADIRRIDPTGMMTTVAGIQEPGYSGDGGPATNAGLYCPIMVTLGPDGALYFADHVNNRIRRVDTSGIITTFAGSGPAGLDMGSFSGDGGPATEATLQEPYGVAFDRAGNLYISDRDNLRIRKVDLNGIISTVAGNGKASYSGDGVLGTQTSIEWPLGIVVDADGNVIFVDANNKRVRKIDGHGLITTIAGTGTNAATGDGGPATEAGLADPENVVVDGSGNIYVTDTVGSRIRRIDRLGIITTVAGSGKIGVVKDGMSAMKAPFVGMVGLAIDGTGNLYVSDGARIYRIDTKGIVTRVAGKSN